MHVALRKHREPYKLWNPEEKDKNALASTSSVSSSGVYRTGVMWWKRLLTL